MKFKQTLTLYLFLICNIACSQESQFSLLGEWTLEISADGDWQPDVIVFRSDNHYFVFNDFDFEGLPGNSNRSDIIFDNGMVTALTEFGKWEYDKDSKQIFLFDRDFVKQNSLFNSYYGKDEPLILNVEKRDTNQLTLCKTEKLCDSYHRNYSPGNYSERVFYSELSEEFVGQGSQIREINLSGLETELTLSYDLPENEDYLSIEDSNENIIFKTENYTLTDKGETEVSLKGVTTLILKINVNKENVEWRINAEIR